MSQHATFDQICDRLRDVISAGRLPDKAAQQAGRLLQRLETPVRFALLGPSGMERARIINALLEREEVPLWTGRPSLELGYGEAPVTRATLSNGRKVLLDGLDGDIDAGTVFLSLTRNNPMLRTIRLLDVVTDGSPAELSMALRWASRRTDVFLWCSNRFEPEEREVWRSVEERFTDHAFLVLWGEDRVARAQSLKSELAGEFLDVIAVDLDAATPARDPGLRRLSDGLLRHVDLGRQADNDSALLFLKKFASLTGDAETAPGEAMAQAQSPVSVPVSMHADPALAGMPDQAADAPVSAVPQVSPQPAPDPAERKAMEGACRTGLSLICDRARQLGALLRSDAAGEVAGIAGHCRETIEHLAENLDSATGLPHGDRAALSELLMNAEELLVLMEIEGSGQPDVDSLCLLLQLRREFEFRLAA